MAWRQLRGELAQNGLSELHVSGGLAVRCAWNRDRSCQEASCQRSTEGGRGWTRALAHSSAWPLVRCSARCSAALTGRQGVWSASRGGMFLFLFASGLPIRAA